ncbi:MAG TPA: biotin-dependent carboxyltransferase family protein [Candidatus Limnocylindrales bacterium]
MTAGPALEILEPGLQLTVQDTGRLDFEHEGVPRAGAADHRSLLSASFLAATPEGAALEATLLGPTFRALRDLRIGLAGADLAPVAQPGNRPLAVGYAHHLRAGEVLECTEAGDPERGCRLYIAVEGGIDVPVVLESRSTSLVGGFGGFEGRALRSGDVLSTLAAPDDLPDAVRAIGSMDVDAHGWWKRPIRVMPGPDARALGGEARLAALLDASWTVSYSSDRRGLRLDSEVEVPELLVASADRPSFGVVPGAIQLTPSGQPIVLMPDGGVTGGYPVIGVVVAGDRSALGQLAPGAPIRFERAPAEAGW